VARLAVGRSACGFTPAVPCAAYAGPSIPLRFAQDDNSETNEAEEHCLEWVRFRVLLVFRKLLRHGVTLMRRLNEP